MPSPRRTVLLLRDVTTFAAVAAAATTAVVTVPWTAQPDRIARVAEQHGPEVHSLAVPADAGVPVAARKAPSGPAAADVRSFVPGPALTQVAHLNAPSTSAYSMVGVTWDDPAAGAGLHVEVRTHGERGWTDWTELEHDDDHSAEVARAEGARGGTAPLWVGASRGVQVRVLAPQQEAPAGLEVELVDPGQGPDLQPMSSTTSLAPMPTIITRRQWGADPRLSGGCWRPIHGPTVKGVVVHHTVNSNDYTRSQSDDIVRGIYAYHTQSQGWCDIGYNFLIDRFGQIFEGRAGGIRTPVRGAHAGVAAVNEATTGVSLIGNFETARPTAAMREALVNFAAWRLESYYLDPHATTVIGGVRYPVLSGHRDIHSTACPGQYVYNWIPRLRDLVAERMGDWRSAIYQKWQRLGGARGWVGVPYTGEYAQSGGRNTRFTNALIYWSKATGAHELHGPVLDGAYRRTGGAAGVLGFPTSDVATSSAGGADRAKFQHGVIYASPKTGSHEVHGPVYDAYAKQGWTKGPLGLPTSDVSKSSAGGASRSKFQGGVIYHRDDLGAHALFGSVFQRYAAQGWTKGPLGLPTSDIVPTTEKDGTRMSFENGAIYQRDDLGANALYGDIFDTYASEGWTTGPLGMPSSSVRRTSAGNGLGANFVGGVIYHRDDLGTHALFGDVFDSYAREGWTKGPLGLPTSDIVPTTEKDGSRMSFERGVIYQRDDLGGHALYGPILDAYARQRYTTGPLGMPSGDIRPTTQGDGLGANFVGGAIYHRDDLGTRTLTGPFYEAYARQRWTKGPLGLPASDVLPAGAKNATRIVFEHGSVYYRSDVGAHEIHGRILKRYAQLGGAGGRLGLPTSDVFAVDGGQRSNFQHGAIRWTSATGTYTVKYF